MFKDEIMTWKNKSIMSCLQVMFYLMDLYSNAGIASMLHLLGYLGYIVINTFPRYEFKMQCLQLKWYELLSYLGNIKCNVLR